MKHLLSLLLFIMCLINSWAQDGYFVSFTDKNGTPYSLDKPEAYLSERAIERRIRQKIDINKQDLPVNPAYVDSLRKAGIDVRHTTKWLNGAIIFSSNTTLMDTLNRVSFIQSIEKTKPATSSRQPKQKLEPTYPSLKSTRANNYGEAWLQISKVNGHYLHDNGLTGEGMQIAVIDAGFYRANELPITKHLWDNLQILGIKDFVNPSSNIFAENTHGMNVLSIMGGRLDQQYLGTAPDASYWLLRTEDASSEHPIEPDYWICALEFADSAGVDVVNTSLGYYEFDYPSKSYTYEDITSSTRASVASDIASSKGMLVVTSAGNEGNNSWHYIGVPADAQHCISVGAIDSDGVRASFSSYGPTYDQRIKPEVSALGVAVAVQNSTGGISKGNGTSFSAPIISGLATCLWQAMPDKNAQEIRQLIMNSSNQKDQPDNSLGYGIPDFSWAYHVSIDTTNDEAKKWTATPNPFNNLLALSGPSGQTVTVSIVDILGNLKYRRVHQNEPSISIKEAASLANGIYIITIENKHYKQHVKVIKSR